MGKNENLEYLKTVIITLLCLVVIISLVIFDVRQNTHERLNRSPNLKSQLDLEAEHTQLEKLYHQEKIMPGDFMINLKIAMLHELFEEWKEAGENYEKAYEKAPKNIFVIYRYALYLVTQKQYERALLMIETLSDRPDKKIMSMKNTFYTSLSNSLAQDQDYLGAVDAAKLASKYAKTLSAKKSNEASSNLAEKYILAADYYVKQKDDEEAVVMLKSSLKAKETSLAKYKLGLVFEEKLPQLSYRLLEEVFESRDAQLVNLEVFYSIITRLYNKSIERQDGTAASFYAHKRDKLKRYITKNYLFTDELKTSDPIISKRRLGWLKKDKHYLAFTIENTTDNAISPLYLKTTIEIPDLEPITFERKIAAGQNTFPADKKPKEMLFKLDDNDIYNRRIPKNKAEKASANTGKVYIWGKKNKNFEWVLLYAGSVNL